VVSDAGCDPNYGFEDLGNAVRKIAIDLGVYIEFGQLRALKKRSKDNSVIEGAYYALGVIDYSTAPEWANVPESEKPPGGPESGFILYIKPGYHGTESADVVAYATANAAFPHESTGDQFFSESQFQSYRTLGFEIMDSVLNKAAENVSMIGNAKTRDLSPDSLCDLIKALEPSIINEAESALKPKVPKVSELLKLVSAEDLEEMRAILAKK
jgi:hypothetical protein